MNPGKPRICKIKDLFGKVCGQSFIPRNSMHVVCSPLCAIHKASHDRDKKDARRVSDQRRAHRAAMTANERKARFDALHSIGCIVCRIYLQAWSEPHIHHLLGLEYRAMGRRANDRDTIPLCPTHHMYGDAQNPSAHGHPAEFKSQFGSQEYLLGATNKMIENAR